ncbi:hypothetical protein AVEN_102439-1 [Araneus ventricosus]|uniref:Uncharacterized protein n=1 Tax=Araneus ventricosus TaxID=182803 RepID=A0A4Y2LT16_ARAVE|nr:hypothetical protein AVEN_102439-1 [Araneus ventricosus]
MAVPKVSSHGRCHHIVPIWGRPPQKENAMTGANDYRRRFKLGVLSIKATENFVLFHVNGKHTRRLNPCFD